MNLEEYYAKYGSQITQPSERLFVEEFLFPLLGSNIEHVVPQYPFIDSTGRSRRIDFVCRRGTVPLAIEVNGETYHAEGVIPDAQFDDNLFRQNEILRMGYRLVRFSYSQLQSPQWRALVAESLRSLFAEVAPSMLGAYELRPTPVQLEALDALDFHRGRGWRKGVVVLPTGTGKTILSAIDAKRVGGRVLFLVHRLDILRQSVDAYKFAWGNPRVGYLTGESREDENNCDVLFASKDSLRKPDELARFPSEWFDYIVVDEVHHGQSPSYREILTWFRPRFMLGMTATPDRTDRKDIFELFDYNKVYELPLQDAIERGFLVPYTYYGLTDNIDYLKIRWQGNRYRVDDLERLLIVPERNAAILSEYLDKGRGDKAIGFCVSIRHAERMAEYFNEHGLSTVAIHSGLPNRDELISDFRANKYQVAFTVDLFNEGVDFPNIRVLLFLRPTESKTVFLQQLGRGLRLCTGKDRVRVLDFIGNYRRANQVRKYLAKTSDFVEETDDRGRRRKKIAYVYSPGCEVKFSAEVEEILVQQDAEELGFDKEDLKGAYFALAEKLQRKPSRAELDEHGEYKSTEYARLFGSWVKFLREIGEYTEASYHYPQGTHVGHVLSVLWFFGLRTRTCTHFDDRFIKLRGGFDNGRVGNYQRQVKYKLQAAMELGVLEDDRTAPAAGTFTPGLTALGKEMRRILEPFLKGQDLTFPAAEDGVPSTEMPCSESEYNALLQRAAAADPRAREIIRTVFLRMHAVRQMLAYLFHVSRSRTVEKAQVYREFFKTPFVKRYCDREGIEEATDEAAKRRCPFLLNVLEALGVVRLDRSNVHITKLLLTPALVKAHEREDDVTAVQRLRRLSTVWKARADILSGTDVSILRELFGAEFLTENYIFDDLEIWSPD